MQLHLIAEIAFPTARTLLQNSNINSGNAIPWGFPSYSLFWSCAIVNTNIFKN